VILTPPSPTQVHLTFTDFAAPTNVVRSSVVVPDPSRCNSTLAPTGRSLGTGSGSPPVAADMASGVTAEVWAVEVQPPIAKLTMKAAVAAFRSRDVMSGVSDHGRERRQQRRSAAYRRYPTGRGVLVVCPVHAVAPRSEGEPSESLSRRDRPGATQCYGRRFEYVMLELMVAEAEATTALTSPDTLPKAKKITGTKSATLPLLHTEEWPMRVTLATEPASPTRPNEDFAAASNTLAVLLDGATLPASVITPCPHDARWFTRALGTRLLTELSAEPPCWIAEGVARAIDAVATDHAKTCEVNDATHPSAAIVILRELPDVYEYYILGDSTLVLDLAGGSIATRTDKRLSKVAVPERERATAAKRGTPERDSTLAALVKAERSQRNVRGGYWIASANPDAAAHGRQGHIGRRQLRRAALLSDGAAAVERYGLMDWRSVLDLMDKDGPQAIIQAVRDAEDSDPQVKRWPRSKVHDDATAVFCAPK
jgi:hypothetical protein